MPRRYAIDPRDPAYNDSDDDALPFNPDDDEPDNSDLLDPHGEWADFVSDPIKERSRGNE